MSREHCFPEILKVLIQSYTQTHMINNRFMTSLTIEFHIVHGELPNRLNWNIFDIINYIENYSDKNWMTSRKTYFYVISLSVGGRVKLI